MGDEAEVVPALAERTMTFPGLAASDHMRHCLPPHRAKEKDTLTPPRGMCPTRMAVASHMRFASVSSGLLLPPPSSPHLPLEQFLELSREVRHYGCVQLDPCSCDYPEPGCGAVLSVGNNEISCCVTLPGSQTQHVVFPMSRVKCWQVTFLGTLLDMDGPQRTLNQNLELRFQYSEESRWQWFVLYTKQAFLLSSCLKKMISEKMAKRAAENPEMQIEVPEQGKSKKYHIQQSQQKDYSSFLPRTSKIKTAEGQCVSGTPEEEDL